MNQPEYQPTKEEIEMHTLLDFLANVTNISNVLSTYDKKVKRKDKREKIYQGMQFMAQMYVNTARDILKKSSIDTYLDKKVQKEIRDTINKLQPPIK